MELPGQGGDGCHQVSSPQMQEYDPIFAIPTPRPSLEGRVVVVAGRDEGKARWDPGFQEIKK